MKNLKFKTILKVFLLVGVLSTVMLGNVTPVSAALISGPDIIAAPGSIVDDPPGATNDHQQAFDEAQGVTLPADLPVDSGVIPAGSVVNSHMIFLNTDGTGFATDTQVWTFDGDILGVMSDSTGGLEVASSPLLGALGTIYPAASFPGRGMESNDSYVVTGNQITVKMSVTEPGDWIRVITQGTLEVDIDIKPGSYPNPVNVKSKGVLPVAILGTEDFDVMMIDPETLQLVNPIYGTDSPRVSPLRWAWEDVNGDGYQDIGLHYKMQEVMTLTVTLKPDRAEMELQIQGKLKEEFGGTPILGEDVIIVINKMYDGE